MTTRLELRLLGHPQVQLDGVAVTDFRTAKVEALLYYLAVTGRAHSRESLVTLLWGDMPEATAKRNLTQVLSLLRKRFAPFLEVTSQHIGLKPEAAYGVDVHLFQQELETINPTQELERLRQAVELYQGDFLQDFYVKEALDFEAWVVTERERLRERLLQALDSLVNHYLGQADYPAGLAVAARLLALEPWRETAHRQMMLLLARSGRREAALAQYESCRQILLEELGGEPLAETTALYERLKAADQPIPHNLPPAVLFVGRARDLEQLRSRLGRSDCRLLTLVGPGGIGKTRLAIEVARRCLASTFGPEEVGCADGVYLVNLAPVSVSSGLPEPGRVINLILEAIATALDFSFQGTVNLKTQLLTHLRRQELLLVLDNFEHLLEGVGLLVELLQTALGLRLLVTSRERLNLPEEWVWEVSGLDYPEGDWRHCALEVLEIGDSIQSLISNLQSYDAVALFCLQAQRVRGDFSLSESDAPHVLRLCRLVEGVPLALELAAGWLRALSCAEVVTRVERSLDFLSSSLRYVPERHRSMRAVFEQSWHMLSGPEQAAFGRLSLFKGGFQREAAGVVARAGLPSLVNLVDKSLLRLTPSGRYHVHELLRQFAAEKLLLEANSLEADQQPEAALVAWQRYSSYYLNLVAQREADLRGNIPRPALSELRAELDNIRQAWHWAVVATQIEDIEKAIGGLARFYDLTSLLEEGASVFGQAATDLNNQAKSSDENSKQAIRQTVVKLWVEQARLLNRRGLSKQALQIIPQAVELAHQIQDTALEALAYHQWGETLSFYGQPALSQTHLEKALDLARLAGLGAIEAEALRHLGIAHKDQGDTARALRFYEESLTCFRQLKDRRGEGMALNSLASLHLERGQWTQAETYYEQAMRIFEEIDYRWGQDIVLNNLGNLRYDLGQYSQAQALCRQGLQICAEIKDYWGESHLLGGLGNIIREQGDFAAAHNYYQQALQLWRTIGARLYEGVILAELALLWYLRGDNQAAYNYTQQAEQIEQEVGSSEIRGLTLTYRGHVQVTLGLLPQAAASYRQALTLYQETGQLHFAREVLAGLSRVALAHGDLAQAQALVAELLPQLTIENLYGAREPFRVYLTCYQVLQAGQDPRAGEVLAAAYRLLHKRAAAIEDERLRRSYLENIPAHQEIVLAFAHQADSLRSSI
ncbi:MAG: tetratricopeptide repeat protein [Anaerolineae bacterium]